MRERLNLRERQTLKALSGSTTMTLRIDVTSSERERIKRAAKQGGLSVSEWAELGLTDLAMVEAGA